MSRNEPNSFAEFERAAGAAAWRRTLAPGECLFRQGDETAAVFGVVSGTVRLVRHVVDGRAVVLYRAGAGSTFAEPALFSPIYHCDAVAETEAAVVGFPTARLRLRMAEDTRLGLALAERLARQVHSLRGSLELRNIRSADERVLAALALRGDASGQVDLGGTLKTFAAEIGLTHEALYRALRRLESAGRLARDGGRLRLL